MFVTLTIHQEEDEQRQLKLTVEVEESRVQKQMDQFIRRFSREAQIPGFRRGKVPRNVIVKRFGEETLRAETVE
jgi:trigger factor